MFSKFIFSQLYLSLTRRCAVAALSKAAESDAWIDSEVSVTKSEVCERMALCVLAGRSLSNL